MSTYRSGQLNAPMFVPLDPPDFETLTDPLRQACSSVWPQFRTWWGGPEGRKQRSTGALHRLAEIPSQLVAEPRASPEKNLSALSLRYRYSRGGFDGHRRGR